MYDKLFEGLIGDTIEIVKEGGSNPTAITLFNFLVKNNKLPNGYSFAKSAEAKERLKNTADKYNRHPGVFKPTVSTISAISGIPVIITKQKGNTNIHSLTYIIKTDKDALVTDTITYSGLLNFYNKEHGNK